MLSPNLKKKWMMMISFTIALLVKIFTMILMLSGLLLRHIVIVLFSVAWLKIGIYIFICNNNIKISHHVHGVMSKCGYGERGPPSTWRGDFGKVKLYLTIDSTQSFIWVFFPGNWLLLTMKCCETNDPNHECDFPYNGYGKLAHTQVFF